MCTSVVWEQFVEFVLEDAGAAWLQKNEWQTGVDLRIHTIQYAPQIAARRVQKTEIVQRPPTADVTLRACDCETRSGQDGFSRGEGLRVVVVIPRIRPQHHLRWGRSRFAPLRHLRWGQLRFAPLRIRRRRFGRCFWQS